jgi:hypothetical protein
MSDMPEQFPSNEAATPPTPEVAAPQIKRPFQGGASGKKNNIVVIAIIGVIFAVLAFTLLTHSPSKKPAQKAKGQTAPQQQQQNVQTPSLPSENGSQQQQEQNPDALTSEQIQKTSQNAQGGATNSSGNPSSQGSTLNTIPAFTPPAVPGANGQWNPPAYGTDGGGSGQAQRVSELRRTAVTKASLTFVLDRASATLTAPHLAESTANSSMVTSSQEINNLGYEPGYHLSAHLESVATTALKAPVIAVVDYDYQRGGVRIIPAGARVIGKIEQASATGIMDIHFDSIRLRNGTTIPISALALNTQMGPLKGAVTGRNRGKQFLLSALGGLGSSAAMFAGSNLNGTLTQADIMRQSAAQNIGQATDMQVQQMQVSEHIIVTVPAGTQVQVTFISPTRAAVSN